MHHVFATCKRNRKQTFEVNIKLIYLQINYVKAKSTFCHLKRSNCNISWPLRDLPIRQWYYILHLSIAIFFLYSFGITSNYISILHYNHIPPYMLSVYITVSFGTLVVILIVIPNATKVYKKSLSIARTWRNYVKSNYQDNAQEFHCFIL